MGLTEYPPNDAGDLARRHLAEGDATGWFEALYASATASGDGVPWARLAPHPALVAWLAAAGQPAAGARALVVGCGLGDDAEAAAGHGYTVTAFDVSASAIELCHERFPASRVTYLTADLFAPPDRWLQGFDLVIEHATVQSLPPDLHENALRQIAGFVAPRGALFLLAAVRDASLTPSGPPWPIAAAALAAVEQAGLRRERYAEHRLGGWTRVWNVEAVYRRPAP